MKTLACAAFAAMLLLSVAAGAQAGVELRWNSCSSPVLNANVEPYAATQHDLIVTLTGNELDANEIDLTLAVYDPCSSDGQFIPQAWRFDAGGCQAGALTIDRPVSLDGCDGLVPLGGLTVDAVTVGEIHTSVGLHNDPVTYPALFIHLAQAFPLRHLVATERYVVARIRLDMSNTVAGVDPAGHACGCGSAARQIRLLSGTLGGPAGSGPIASSGLIGEIASWADFDVCIIDKPGPPATNWGADPSCLTTAAHASSWGAIKAQYR